MAKISNYSGIVVYIGRILFLTILIAITGWLSLRVKIPLGYASLIWPPAGLALGAFLLRGHGIWPGVFIGSAVAFATTSGASSQIASNPAEMGVALALAFGATLQPIAAYLLIRHYVTLPYSMGRLSSAVPILLIGGPLTALIPASICVVTLLYAGKIDAQAVMEHWITFWVGSSLGVIIFTPLILAFVTVFSRTQSPRVSAGKSYALLVCILALTMVGTLIAWKSTSEVIQQRNQARFDALVQESEKALLHKMASYEQSLLGGVGLFTGSHFISRAEWHQYVNVIGIQKRFPGINGLGYIANVKDEDLSAFLFATQADGAPDFAIKPEGEFSNRFIIKYIEPADTNLPAFGLNIAFEENRKAAALRAAATGKSAITKRILLVQDAEKTPGFLLLSPVYEKGTPLETEEQRLGANIGWVYAPFIGKNFLGDLTLSQGSSLHLDVYDGDVASDAALIYHGDDEVDDVTERSPLFSAIKPIEIMQQQWTLQWRSTEQFDTAATDYQPEIVLISGAVLTAFLGLLFSMSARRSAIVQREVEVKTREIADTQKNLQAVLDTVVDGIVSISSLGEIRAFNPSAERIFGYRAEEVIGKNVKVLMPEPYQSEHDGYLFNFLTTGEKKVIGTGRTVSARRKDGSIFPMELAVNQMSFEEERGFVGSIRDITEREQAKVALEASEKTFRQAMEQASIGMGLVSPIGTWIRVNKSICDLLGYEEEELLSMDVQALSHPDDLQEDLEHIRDLITGKSDTYQMEKRFIAKNGNTIWTHLSASLVRKSDGTPDYLIKQLVDITERREVDRMKSEFISIISHELRTPLTSIRGALGLVVGAMASSMPQQVAELIGIAHKNSERLITLVNDILDIDKLGSGQMQFEITREKLAPMLEQAVDANTAYADGYGVGLVLETVSPEIELNVDHHRVSQVLANLISNAAKFSDAGGKVNVSVEVSDGMARVSVRDQGPGIPDEFRGRIFSKFAQADSSATRKKGGTGLGLQISKQLVEQMNGHIGFDSVVGEGTTFWFEFPLAGFEASEASVPITGSAKIGVV